MSSYNEARDKFAQMVFDQKCSGRSPCGFIKEGKIRDRLFLLDAKGTPRVEYFIHRSSGLIEHAKSNTIHNTKRPYGTVQMAEHWDWSGKGGVNKSDPNWIEVGSYNDYKHYLPLGEEKPVRKPHTKKVKLTPQEA